MKKVKGIAIVLLSVIVAGCSNANSEQQEDNSVCCNRIANSGRKSKYTRYRNRQRK